MLRFVSLGSFRVFGMWHFRLFSRRCGFQIVRLSSGIESKMSRLLSFHEAAPCGPRCGRHWPTSARSVWTCVWYPSRAVQSFCVGRELIFLEHQPNHQPNLQPSQQREPPAQPAAQPAARRRTEESLADGGQFCRAPAHDSGIAAT